MTLPPGVERLIVARVFDDRAEIPHHKAAVPGAQLIVCRQTAPVDSKRVTNDSKNLGLKTR